MHKLLKNWLANLDSQIGDTYAEIEKRRRENETAVNVRDDLMALVDYLDSNELPDSAMRALKRCIDWNPFCRHGVDTKKS